MEFGISIILAVIFIAAAIFSAILGKKSKKRVLFILSALCVVAALALLVYGLFTLILIGGID